MKSLKKRLADIIFTLRQSIRTIMRDHPGGKLKNEEETCLHFARAEATRFPRTDDVSPFAATWGRLRLEGSLIVTGITRVEAEENGPCSKPQITSHRDGKPGMNRKSYRTISYTARLRVQALASIYSSTSIRVRVRLSERTKPPRVLSAHESLVNRTADELHEPPFHAPRPYNGSRELALAG